MPQVASIGVLARHLAAYRRGQTEKFSATPLSDAHSKQPSKRSPKAAKQSQAKREERLSPYKQVVTLRKLGLSQMAIADQVGRAHATVSRWLAHGTFPEQQPRQRMTSLDSSRPFLRERWEAGCHTIAQLYRELVARGSTKSYESVYDQLVRLRAIREEERCKRVRSLPSSSVISAGDFPLPSPV